MIKGRGKRATTTKRTFFVTIESERCAYFRGNKKGESGKKGFTTKRDLILFFLCLACCCCISEARRHFLFDPTPFFLHSRFSFSLAALVCISCFFFFLFDMRKGLFYLLLIFVLLCFALLDDDEWKEEKRCVWSDRFSACFAHVAICRSGMLADAGVDVCMQRSIVKGKLGVLFEIDGVSTACLLHVALFFT